MEHPTPNAEEPHSTPESVVLPEPRHDAAPTGLPPLIGAPKPDPTLPADAGRPITPPPADGPQRTWVPGEPWRPGGGIHGHDQPATGHEPLSGIESAYPTHRPRSAAPPVHMAGPEPRPRRRGSLLVTGIAAAVLGGALGLGGAALLGAFDDPDPVAVAPTTAPEIIQITEIVPGNDLTPASAVGLKVVPSVVTVEVGGINGSGTFTAFGSGSGVVLTSDGAIATNHHVVDGADDLRVVFQDGRIFDASIVGTDQLTDLAVLQIDAEGLTPIELGTTEPLVIGDSAIAVGSPLGLSGGASLTVGVVSAFNREVRVSPDQFLYGMLQTDAPITNGSSGGALVDAEGKLIGITTAIGVSEAGPEGIGFAIPVELVTRITDELIERGDVRHAFLGVGLGAVFEDQGPARVPAGAGVERIEPGTSAELFGLEVDDRIVGLDDIAVHTSQDVINTLRLYRVGDTVSVTIIRDGISISIDVELGERPDGI